MLKREAISWNSLISIFHHLRFHGKALLLYQRMVAAGVRETSRTFPSVLSACSSSGNLSIAQQLHCRILLLPAIHNPFVSSALVSLYAKISYPDLAVKVFNEIPVKTTAACNSILDGFAGSSRRMMIFFSEMNFIGVHFNGVSLSYALRGCGSGELLWEGKQIHCYAAKLGFVPSDLFVSNALVDFYSACEICEDATAAMAAIADGEIISWNSIVAVNAAADRLSAAVNLFVRMLAAGRRPSVRSLVSLLNCCSRMKNLDLATSIQGMASKLGLHCSSLHVLSALIDAYGKCGDVKSSMSLWEESLEEANLECCNSMITSLIYSGLMDDAVKLFAKMPERNLRPDSITISATLRAVSSSSSSSLVSVCQIHCWAAKLGLAVDIAVACSLISAYSRTGGAIDRVIADVLEPNLICFTAAISAFGRNGEGIGAIATMEEMIKRGIIPDKVALLSAMSSCDHAGMVEEGRKMLGRMEELGLELDRRHYSAMVSLLARAGMVKGAAEVAARSPPDVAAWSAVLRSSGEYGEIEVGRTAARKLLELQPWSTGIRRQVAGFFAAVEDLEALAEARKTMMRKEMKKEMGSSLVEVKEQIFICLQSRDGRS